eukprot:m.62006 g.62006  ORF g.62006 m.62006 type:complete len:145 (+) comp8012_c0_seq2:97-531(+)
MWSLCGRSLLQRSSRSAFGGCSSTYSVSVVPVLDDNYVHVIQLGKKNEAVCVDAGCASTIKTWCETRGVSIRNLFITHHHHDHVGGVDAIVSTYAANVHGADSRIPGEYHLVKSGDSLKVVCVVCEVLLLSTIVIHCSGMNNII